MPQFVKPNKVLEELELEPSMNGADFGCGSGAWTIALAKKLEKGKVFAVDIKEEALSALTSKANLQNISNIEKVTGNIEEKVVRIPGGSCNVVMIVDLLFQVENKAHIFKEAKRVLKPEGKILVVEWKLDSPFAPQKDKPSPEEIKNIAKNSGFEVEKQIPAGDYHFGIIMENL